MPQENVEIVRRSFAEFDRGGIESALGYFDPEIGWTTTDAYIESATYRGHERRAPLFRDDGGGVRRPPHGG